MSTWTANPNDQKYACFSCHLSFSRKSGKCLSCSGELHRMGIVFKPPKRRNQTEWRAIEMLWEGGVRYEHGDIANHDYILKMSFDPEKWYRARLSEMIRTYGVENPVWQLPLYQFSKPRPLHPRDVPSYLDWWWGSIRTYVTGILSLYTAFHLSPPTIQEHEEVVGWLRLASHT